MTGTWIILIMGFLLHGSESTQKRSDDSNPLTAVVEQLSMEVTNLKARLDAMDHHVAFSAQFSTWHPSAKVPNVLKFDEVIFNDGNAYDPTLGIFTAPFSGVYTFSIQIFTYKPDRPMVDIQVNGAIINRMAFDTNLQNDNGEDSNSMTVTLRLPEGDRVTVATATSDVLLWGHGHSFFTGALLYTFQA